MKQAIKDLFTDVAEFLHVDLQHFDTQKTTDGGLTAEMKQYYSDYLIDNAVPNLVHDQFGQKQPIPKGKGKTIEFRKYSPLAKALTPLSEGATPSGKSLNVSTITATVSQYGDYIELSDILMLTAIDNNLVHATKLLGNQSGETLDTITREVINGGTNVQYADAQVLARYLLVGGDATAANNHYLSVNCVRRGVRTLKNNKAKKINGSYVAIIHPDVSYDITGDDDWVNAAQYAGSTQIFEGEIGKIHGVRFVESTEAKIFHAADLVAVGSTNAKRNLTVASLTTKTFTIQEALTAGEASALVGRKLIIKGYQYTVASAAAGAAGAATITVSETVSGTPTNNEVIYPGEAGAAGRDVYSTLVLGEDAYGTTEIAGGGLENIVKQLGSAGTADPLNQRATTGWKATKTAEILVDNYMVRIETTSTFQSGAN
jgi:N4-gp56 family major capsid protein